MQTSENTVRFALISDGLNIMFATDVITRKKAQVFLVEIRKIL